MKNASILPRHLELISDIYLGENVLKHTSDICKKYSFSKLAIITGKNAWRAVGGSLEEFLGDKKIDISVYKNLDQVTEKVIKSISNEIKGFEPNCILGVGGGTRLDQGKLTAEYLGIPFISIPTSAAHDGIASNYISLIGDDGSRYSRKSILPIALIADTKIISQAPPKLNIAGFGDVVSNFTAAEDWRLDSLQNGSEGKQKTGFSRHLYLAGRLSAQYLVNKVNNSKNGDINYVLDTLIANLLGSAILMNIAGSSQPCSGAEHKFCHVIERDYKISELHGNLVGLGTIISSYLQKGRIQDSLLFRKMSWRTIKAACDKLELPTTGAQIGLEPNEVYNAFVAAREFRPERYTILNKVKNKEIKKALKKTGIV